MTSGASCCGIGDRFDHRIAERDLTKYRRTGPSPSTRRLLAAIREVGVEGKTLLDVGGGIGTIAMELLGSGAAHATVVDESAAYLAAAREE
jgi:predicted RNA methylase